MIYEATMTVNGTGDTVTRWQGKFAQIPLEAIKECFGNDIKLPKWPRIGRHYYATSNIPSHSKLYLQLRELFL